MSIREKAEAAAKQLLEATQDDLIEWTPEGSHSSLSSQITDLIGSLYTAHYKGKKFGVYKKKYTEAAAHLAVFTISTSPYIPPPTRNHICLIDQNTGNVAWEFPSTPFSDDLYQSVILKAHKIEEALDDIIYG